MRDGLPCFLLFLIVVVIAVVAWYTRSHSRDLQTAFLATARWYHGRLERHGWLGQPTIRIPYNQSDLNITIGLSQSGRKCTQATFEWREDAPPVRVFARQFGLSPYSKRNAITTGDAEWDRLFVIESEEPLAARALLSGGVRAAILMLSRIRRSGSIDIVFGGGELRIQKLMMLDQTAELSAFVRHSMELFDQASLAGTTGIEFVDHLQAQLIEDAKCPICGDKIVDDLVFCGRCKTPHHSECWHYNGKCATYACGETNYAIPRVAKPR